MMTAPAERSPAESVSQRDRDFWTEILRGAGIILKAIGVRYLGKKITISSN